MPHASVAFGPLARWSALAILAYVVFLPDTPGGAIGGIDEKPLAVEIIPISFSPFDGNLTRSGRLEWRGGFEIDTDDERFGGLSGMVLSDDGTRMVAVSDLGWWFEASLGYQGGMLVALSGASMGRLLDESGRPFRGKSFQDAEAVAADGRSLDGDLLVGFERETRLLRYPYARDRMAARPKPVQIPKQLRAGPDNKELEAVGRFRADGLMKGARIAISERQLDRDGNILGWIFGVAGTRTIAFERIRDFDITDLAIDFPTQDLFTLERRFSPLTGAGMVIRRFDAADLVSARPLAGETLIEANQTLNIDNMEGLALTRTAGGELRLTVVSDDNYNGFQRTLLMQFAVLPGAD